MVRSQIKDIERQMDAVIEHWHLPPAAAQPLETNSDSVRDVDVLRPIPGVGRTLTVLLSEACSSLEQRDYRALRTLSGVAPVTQRSGKKKRSFASGER